ncbi:hypothetical protein L7F22_012180 [Adiantum nelumboides]|nr:hypothetical protein [Adiantum nelumboides]
MTHTRQTKERRSPLLSPLKHYHRKRQPFVPSRSPPAPLPLPSLTASSTPPQSPQSLNFSSIELQQAPVLQAPAQAAMEELTSVLAKVNIKFPTFKGLSTEDVDDHARRFVSLCRGRGLNREDAYLVLFPSTLDSLADKWYSQFAENHFTSWATLSQHFCEAFRPGDFQERVLDKLANLMLQPKETFAELVTRTKSLVAKLPQQPGEFMVKKWVEKALPKSSQQKLAYCHFCEKSGHEDKDCYYIKGLRQIQQSLGPSLQQGLTQAPNMVSPYGNSNFMPPLLNTPTVQGMSTTFMPQNFYHHNASTAPQSFYTSASNSMQQEQRPPRPPYRPSNRPILCYKCGEYGHYQSKCALPEGSPPCHHCPDSKDHYSKDCPKQRASSSSGSTQNQQEFTFPKINLITVNTIPQPSPATHVVDPQQVEESAGVLTRAQRAALGLSLPTRLSPLSFIPQHVSSNESLTGAISKPNSILSDIDGAFLEAMADLQQGNEFFRCLAICHTVLPEGDELPDKITYQAASPDEAALVTAAKMFGFFFFRRSPTTIKVRESHIEKIGRVQDVEYEIMNVLEFNSTRKRQSVICRYPNGRLVLYCKGADSVIYERLTDRGNTFKDVNRDHLEYFGAAGLRTLCLAYRDLDISLYESWNEKFVQAKSALRDREKKLDEVAELIERDLVLLGCTAIEDKLQEGVPACIETLAKAGIKIWVLTGDKMETAINIAYACSLINNGMKQFIINSDTKEIREIEDRGDPIETARMIEHTVSQKLHDSLQQAFDSEQTQTGLELALIIDGRCLMHALDPQLRGTLLKLSMLCKAVVCCRVSPLQKAQVTSLIKDGARKITLSIGDGANDVSMIQAAHIGVGISGLEGMQAVMASDFAIAQFRFLTELLLVHGRLSYIRISKVVCYFFYKNLMFTLTQFWFNLYTGFSGQRFYDDWFQSLYNVVFTALPVIIVGIFDKDVSLANARKYPQLYKAGIENAFFKWRILIVWALSAVYQSIILFYFPAKAVMEGKNGSGRMLGLWDAGTMAFTCIVITVNVRLLLACNFVTKWHLISIFGSILAWFIFIFLYSGIRNQLDRQGNVYKVIFIIMGTWYFWLLIVLVPISSLAVDFCYEGLQRWFAPRDYQIIQEVEKAEGSPADGFLLVESPYLSSEEQTSIALAQLPREMSRHTGYSFDSPCFDSFFASQEGVSMSHRSYEIARRASMRTPSRLSSDAGQNSPSYL